MTKKPKQIDMFKGEPRSALTAAERKRLQRERDKSRGRVEITVKVPLDRVDEIRAIAQTMCKRKKRADAGVKRQAGNMQP